MALGFYMHCSQVFWGVCAEFCLATQHLPGAGGGGGFEPPPPPDPDFTVGNYEIYKRRY